MNRLLLASLLIWTLLLPGCTAAEDSITVYTDGPQTVTVDEGDYIVVGGVVDGETAAISLDEDTGGLLTLDPIHHAMHQGRVFYVFDVTDLGNGENRTFQLFTPVIEPLSHFYWKIDLELEAQVEIFEDPQIVKDGTAVTVFNRNRNSSVNNTLLVWHTPTLGFDGTLIYDSWLGEGKKAGGVGQALDGLILKSHAFYVIRITNHVADNNVISTKFIWVENAYEE